MTYEKIIEKMAMIEFGDLFEEVANRAVWLRNKNDQQWYVIRNYISDHNDVQRVLNGFSGKQLVAYSRELHNKTKNRSQTDYLRACFKATPIQKCEAILKSLGRWETTYELL